MTNQNNCPPPADPAIAAFAAYLENRREMLATLHRAIDRMTEDERAALLRILAPFDPDPRAKEANSTDPILRALWRLTWAPPPSGGREGARRVNNPRLKPGGLQVTR